MQKIKEFLNKDIKPTEVKNTFVPSAKIRIQSTVDEGKGLDFNQKAQHIFGLIKQMK